MSAEKALTLIAVWVLLSVCTGVVLSRLLWGINPHEEEMEE